MTVQNLYTQYLDGKITKQKFLYEVRRDQNLDMISSSNSFDDVVKILKNKSIISEKAHKEAKESEGKQEVDIIAKTIDMVNPYEYTRGMEFELGIMDVPATNGDLSEDNILKAQKKVLANLTKNPSFYFDKINGKEEVGHEWIEATKKEIEKIGKGKKNVMREGYSAVLDLPNGYYFAIDDDWEDEYQGKNGMFFTISGNNIYDKDGESIQSSPREFLSQFTPEEILKVSSDKKNAIGEGIHDQDITSSSHTNVKGEMGDYDPAKRAASLNKLQNFGPKEGDVSAREIAQALIPIATKSEIAQYFQSLSKAGDKFETVDDYVEDFRNYVADKSLEEHGQYADRVADVNADSSPLNEKQEAIYKKYSESTGIPMENLMAMVREAKAKIKEDTFLGKDAIDDLKKHPKYTTLSSDGKKNAEDDLKKGGSVTIG